MTTIILSEKDKLILKAMLDLDVPSKASEIAAITNLLPVQAGNRLNYMTKGKLVELVDKKKKLWLITDMGKSLLAQSPPVSQKETEIVPLPLSSDTSERQPLQTPPPDAITRDSLQTLSTDTVKRHPQETPSRIIVTTGQPAQVPTPPALEAQPTIVPSQAAILRDLGERLGISSTPKKGEGAALDAIIYYTERTANMNNLTSVWNSITQMGVPAHIIKRWITLYAQTIPKEIPPELKERLDTIGEKDTVAPSTEKTDEISPKPKRFSLVGNEIIGDPEGDLYFKEALQQRAQNLGAAPAEANTAATIIEALKVGPEMSTSLLTVLLPLLTKEPAKHDDAPLLTFMQSQQQAAQNQMQLLQQMIITATEEKHKAELESLRAEIRTGQKPPESNQQIQQLTQQIENLRTQLQAQQIETLTQQSKTQAEQLQAQISRLEQQMTLAAQGKQVDSKIGLMSEVLKGGLDELKGVRTDLRPVAEHLIKGRPPIPPPRTDKEKAAFGRGLDKGIERSKEAKRLADELWGKSGSSQG